MKPFIATAAHIARAILSLFPHCHLALACGEQSPFPWALAEKTLETRLSS
jgi:hypothetical protein